MFKTSLTLAHRLINFQLFRNYYFVWELSISIDLLLDIVIPRSRRGLMQSQDDLVQTVTLEFPSVDFGKLRSNLLIYLIISSINWGEQSFFGRVIWGLSKITHVLMHTQPRIVLGNCRCSVSQFPAPAFESTRK